MIAQHQIDTVLQSIAALQILQLDQPLCKRPKILKSAECVAVSSTVSIMLRYLLFFTNCLQIRVWAGHLPLLAPFGKRNHYFSKYKADLYPDPSDWLSYSFLGAQAKAIASGEVATLFTHHYTITLAKIWPSFRL